jgi:hypothetical protein
MNVNNKNVSVHQFKDISNHQHKNNNNKNKKKVSFTTETLLMQTRKEAKERLKKYKLYFF